MVAFFVSSTFMGFNSYIAVFDKYAGRSMTLLFACADTASTKAHVIIRIFFIFKIRFRFSVAKLRISPDIRAMAQRNVVMMQYLIYFIIDSKDTKS